MPVKSHYKDSSRFPKIIENGYELEFKKDYDLTAKTMLKDIAKKAIELTNKNTKK